MVPENDKTTQPQDHQVKEMGDKLDSKPKVEIPEGSREEGPFQQSIEKDE